MTQKNYAISVRARLLNLSRSQGQDFQRLLTRYAIERLLYRLSTSAHADDFVLKGATLFTLWMGKPHRVTKDLDLLGRGSADVERLRDLFKEIAGVACHEDGLVFDTEGISAAAIREDALYRGVRVIVPCELAGARLSVQVDVGLGDATVPKPTVVDLTSLLGLPSPRLRAYARETVVAEKLEALVILGLTTSRMKDLYDLDLLRRSFTFDDMLVASVRATFARRGTPIPTRLPVGLSDAFAQDSVKQTQWRAFLRKAATGEARTLTDIIDGLREWLWPILQRALTEE